MEPSLFDEVADAVQLLVPSDLGTPRTRARRYGIKLWFGAGDAGREHYEAQVIGPRDVPAARVLALEVGFHAEHPKVADNDVVLAHLLGHERRWRKELGPEAEAGPFLGRGDRWRRVSEAWLDPDLSDPDLVFDVATRLTDYVIAIEPLQRSRK